MTAACAAILAHRGELDMESALLRWIPELPAWARTVRLRHLVHHTGALPADTRVDAVVETEPDRTTAAVLRAGFVVLALVDDAERATALAGALLDDVCRSGSARGGSARSRTG